MIGGNDDKKLIPRTLGGSEIGYCGNPECPIIQQAKRECKEEKCLDQKDGPHAHCKKCHELLEKPA